MCTKQRLVVCLDGTWNNQDDSTNVLQHFALALNGALPHGGIRQNKHYIAGVGTGVLDRISGGGFAFGLEENVRAAYDWLVANYTDDRDPANADEIYIFGFSRGAYTARSLVGFISTCGLLRRGAPLSVNQLWNDYAVLGRQRENRTSVWDVFFDDPPTTVRRINDLVCDPWNVDVIEGRRKRKDARAGDDTQRVPGQLVDDLNTTERLLVRWSRRVKITYLGIYDTVGAVGFDALAIPGLTSRLAMHHNMRPTRLIQHCRHALAIDEHRSSFKHTPFVQYLWHGNTEDDNQNAEMAAAEHEADPRNPLEHDRAYWDRQSDDWRQRIEQRWFVGAHSNVGGGYPDNELAQRPLEWLLEGACNAGLVCEPFKYLAPAAPPVPRDSYAEFAKPLWAHVIRGKRCYRPIDPNPELRASCPRPGAQNGHRPAGFSLVSINEDVDQSVLDRAKQLPDYRPPNLLAYARRRRADNVVLRDLAAESPAHTWLGDTATPYLILTLWAAYAALGLLPFVELFAPELNLSPTWRLGFGIGALALFFVFVDWHESSTNFRLAIKTSDARWRAFLDSAYWFRTIGVVLLAVGALASLAVLWTMGWNGDGLTLSYLMRWAPIPLLAGAGVALVNLLDRPSRARTRAGLVGAGLGLLVAAGSAIAFVGSGWLFQHVIAPGFGRNVLELVSPAPKAHAAGLLLLLQFATAYFVIALHWAGEPLSTANLGSIVRLQKCRTPAQVMQVLENWREMLANQWSGEDDDVNGPAGQRVRDLVRQALWRDMFGFIPVYFLTLTFAARYVVQQLARQPWSGWISGLNLESLASWLPFIVWLPTAAAVADYIEDACHLRYLAHHERREPIPSWLTTIAAAASSVKFVAFGASLAFVPIGLALGAVHVAWLGPTTGWRGTAALMVVVLVFAAAIAIVIAGVRTSRARKLRARQKTHMTVTNQHLTVTNQVPGRI